MYPYCFIFGLSVCQTWSARVKCKYPTKSVVWSAGLGDIRRKCSAWFAVWWIGQKSLHWRCCGDDLHISSYEQAIGFDLQSGDFLPLVTTLQARASRQQKQVAILISSLRNVAVLTFGAKAIAIVDSHLHGQREAMVGYVPLGQSSCNDIVNWYSGWCKHS